MLILTLGYYSNAQESHLSGSHEFYINSLYSYDPLLAGIRNNGGHPVLNSKDGGTLYLNRDVSGDTKIQSASVSIASFLQTGLVGIGTDTPLEKLEVAGNIQIGNNQFLKGKRPDGGVSNLVGYIPSESGHHILSFSEYSSIPSEVRIYTPTDLNQGISIYSDKRLVFFRNDGNVGIGIDNPDSKLVVDGKIRSEEVKVEIINGPDYVFEENYELRTLEDTKEYISTNRHLPEIPSAKEMEADGIELGDMNMRLLKKVEELTLYLIEQNEEIQELKKEVTILKNK